MNPLASTGSVKKTSSTGSNMPPLLLTMSRRARSSTLVPTGLETLLEIVSVLREDTEIVIHAMQMQRIYEPLLRNVGESDG